MAERRLTRRDLLERIAAVGATAALAPIVAACSTLGASASAAVGRQHRPDAAPSAARARPPSRARRATPEPTPVPTPESELFIYNWDGYIGETTRPTSRRSTGSRSSTTSSPTPDPDHQDPERRQGRRLRPDLPGLDRCRAAGPRRGHLRARPVAHPEHQEPWAELAEPGLRPGQQVLHPELLVDDRDRLGTRPRSPRTSRAGKRSGMPSTRAIWRCSTTSSESSRPAAFRLGFPPNTTDEAQLDQILALLKTQKPLLRKYTATTSPTSPSGQLWMTQAWSGDWVQMTYDKPNIEVRHPERGRDQGQRRDGRPVRAPSTRSRPSYGSTSTSTPR